MIRLPGNTATSPIWVGPRLHRRVFGAEECRQASEIINSDFKRGPGWRDRNSAGGEYTKHTEDTRLETFTQRIVGLAGIERVAFNQMLATEPGILGRLHTDNPSFRLRGGEIINRVSAVTTFTPGGSGLVIGKYTYKLGPGDVLVFPGTKMLHQVSTVGNVAIRYGMVVAGY